MIFLTQSHKKINIKPLLVSIPTKELPYKKIAKSGAIAIADFILELIRVLNNTATINPYNTTPK